MFLDASPAGEKIGRHTAALAQRHDAHLVAIYGVSRDGDRIASEGYVRGKQAIRQVIERRRLADERKVLTAGRRFADLTREYEIGSEFRIVWRDGWDDDAVLRALHCDLIVAAYPQPTNLPVNWSAERLLLATGTPVLLIPHAWSGGMIGDHVVVAWNRSREARRAVTDAMPFISAATTTTILTIDGNRYPEQFGEDPGANLVQHLTRHDAKAEVAHIASEGVPIADVIIAQTIERQADLLVVGAYSRPRTTELLFGGVTRSLLAATRVPMLISR